MISFGPRVDNSVLVTNRRDGKLDPVPSYAFHMEIDGIVEASFTQCSGLSVSREVTMLREGGRNDAIAWMHTGITFGKVTLTSGIAYSDALWLWFIDGAENAKVKVKQASILQITPYTDRVARRYNLVDCIPTTWTGPSLNTSSNEAAVETLEIAFKRFTLINGV